MDTLDYTDCPSSWKVAPQSATCYYFHYSEEGGST